MMLRPFILLLLASPLALAAPVPKELRRSNAQAILGTWQLVVHSDRGQPPTPQSVKWRLEPDGKAFIMNPGDIAISYKLHPHDSPKGFDWQWPTSMHLGLYAIEGDTLKVVITSVDSKIRPTELQAGPGVIYCEFARVHPEGKR